MKYLNSQKGQTIIEAVVALALVIVVLTAITVAVISTVNNAEFARNQALASKYTQQGMEFMRYLRNNPPSTGFTFDSYASQTTAGFCMDPSYNPNTSALSTSGSTCNTVSTFPGGSFVREVKFDNSLNANCSLGTRVTVTTYWSSGKCGTATIQARYCHKSQLVSCFSNPTSSGNTL